MTAVFGLGELLWDCFPDRRLPGGAPANVAFQLQQFGLTAGVITRVGTDEPGAALIDFLLAQGLSTQWVQRDPLHATGRVTIDLSDPTAARYEFLADSAWDFLSPEPALLVALRSAQAVCFGSLAQRGEVSRSAIHACLKATPPECLIVFDVNLRPPFWSVEVVSASLAVARVVKLNDEEVKVLGPALGWGTLDDWGFAGQVLDRYPQVKLVCITRGGAGCLLVSRDGSAQQAGLQVNVVDTVGAGDAFAAALIWGLLQNWSLAAISQLANATGALVASRAGAMPSLREELAELVAQCTPHVTQADPA